MKGFFLSMLISAGLGPLLLGQVASENQWAYQYSFHAAGGTLGMAFFMAVLAPKDVQQMARDSVGNLLVAISLGPPLSYWIDSWIHVGMVPQLMIATGAVLGCVGAGAVRAIVPIWNAAWLRWNTKKADEFSPRTDREGPSDPEEHK